MISGGQYLRDRKRESGCRVVGLALALLAGAFALVATVSYAQEGSPAAGNGLEVAQDPANVALPSLTPNSQSYWKIVHEKGCDRTHRPVWRFASAQETAAEEMLYLPLVTNATPTSTPVVPHWVERYLCCWGALDNDCIVGGVPCYGIVSLDAGESATWLSEALPWDIVSSTYHFSIGARGTDAVFRVELLLDQEAQELPLAAYTFTAADTPPYKRTVQGTEPSVQIGKDRLVLRISLVSGKEAYISIGMEPGTDWSYVEFKVG